MPKKEAAKPIQTKTNTKSGSVIAPPKRETRSEQILVRLTPSLKGRATKAAKSVKVPLTEAINQLLENWVNEQERGV